MKKSSCLFLLLATFASPVHAEIKLNGLFADGLVLQCEMPAPIWGTADPGEPVTVEFAGQKKSVVAGAAGRWQVKLDALPASAEPRELMVTGKNSSVKVSDVLVGEVWLASGQSNMGSPVSSLHDADAVLAQAGDPQLRFFTVTKRTAAAPQGDAVGKWEAATPLTAKGFSAVAYFFAREIRRDRKCPVAVVHGSWGGTDIETWISLDGLKQNPPLQKTLGRWNQAVADHQKVQAQPNLVPGYENDLKQWQKEVAPAYDAATKKYNADKAAGKAVGPKPQPARPEPTNPDPMAVPGPSRRPSTPTVNFNGMIAPLAPFAMRGAIWYQGENNGSRGLEYRDLFPRLIEDWRNHWEKAGGAADADFPFLFVQLPANGADATPVAESGWPWLREAQLLTLKVSRTGMAITIDVGDPNNVHPADKLDVGLRLALVAKKTVYGENAVASGPLFQDFKVEGGKIRLHFTETGSGLTSGVQPWCAPGVQPFPKDRLIGFFVAGADKKWVVADASIDGDSVVVSSAQVPQPVAVRYGWANSPRCNLYNQEGLPASPFRTDDWPK